jgi:small-conductance mechanosensitive channel
MAAPVVFISLPVARMSVVLLLILLFLLPITRLLPLIAGSGTRLVYFYSGFYALNGLVGIVELEPSVGRELTASLFAAALFVLAWWGRPARMRTASAPYAGSPREIVIIRCSLAVLALILVSNVFGFLLLSNLARVTVLLSSYIGAVMYTLARVATTLFEALLRSPRLGSLATIRLHEGRVAKWTKRVMSAGALFWWIYVTLDLLALREKTFQGIAAVFNARLAIKAFSISLGDILAFVCVLAFGYMIAAAIRFVLREEILSHLHLSRGVPEVISTSFYYVLLLLVFFMSLSAAGVQLDKLTVLTGAFGVGLGFGLQNLVNNFVSGLILQFERPIRIGDVLEVGSLSGEVSRIGIRSSTMRTFQGAEVIIPNSAFVSDQVINWTLSEPRRRVDIAVRVAYGTAPERVMGILSRVAGDHVEVLREPPPGVFFQGFGPSALEFLLMFWPSRIRISGSAAKSPLR